MTAGLNEKELLGLEGIDVKEIQSSMSSCKVPSGAHNTGVMSRRTGRA